MSCVAIYALSGKKNIGQKVACVNLLTNMMSAYCSRLFNSLHSNVVYWEVGESWEVSGVLNPPAKPIASPLNTIALHINTHDGIHCKL